MSATWNPNDKSSLLNLSNDNLTITSSSSSWGSVRATIGHKTGKLYYEETMNNIIASTSSDKRGIFGVSNKAQKINSWIGDSDDSRGFAPSTTRRHPGSIVYGNTLAIGDTLGIALDIDNGTIEYFKNGVSMGIAWSDVNDLKSYDGYIYATSSLAFIGASTTVNFGETPFKFSIPDGFRAYGLRLNKTLILSDGKYMKYENGWQTVSNSLPTLEEFEEHGMEDMSALDRSSSDPYDSPLDELEGDFEVVAWTDDEDEKILHMGALPVSQFVHVIEGAGLVGDFSGITVTEEFDGTAENGTVRYLISDDKTSWCTWSSGDFELVSSLDNIESDGMTLDTVNNLSASDWEKWTYDTLFIGVYLDEDMQDQTKAYVENIDVELSIPTKTPEIDDVKMYILNTTATINVEFAGSTVSGYVEDADSTRVQYRVILNDEYYFPKSGEFTSLAPSPLSINLTLPNEDIKIDENNTLKIEFQDYWGSVDYWQTTFIGTYSGLLFTDEQGDYYSNEVGEVLKYLDFGVIIAGQTTVDHAIKLKNTYGYSVENIRITADESDFPDGMSAQFSKTQTPFQNEDVLVYNDIMEDGDEKTFYIRLATQLGVTSNAEGMFDISVKADQVTNDGS